jgi:superfamily I DNA/RNA helicase
LREQLDGLSYEERVQFRNDNAQNISRHPGVKILIVSGPGTGKGTVFKQRIVHWLEGVPDARILVLSFVRKLVTDLRNDIQNAAELTEEEKLQIDVHTLHKYARSVVERNHGTSALTFGPHFRIIGHNWKEVVWDDVLNISGEEDKIGFAWKEFEKQLHNAKFEDSARWGQLKDAYFLLSKFYNGAGFADLIIHAGVVSASEAQSRTGSGNCLISPSAIVL